MAEKKRLLSGVKPTAHPHIGNYFGAMKQFVDLLQTGSYECFVFVADYHGLNFIQNAKEMRGLIVDLVKDYIAIGLDPEQVTIYKQSDVPEHTELAWIFDTITTMPYLMRAHAFKDAEAKNKEISVGAFNYPVLMAADILLYDTDVVPVGQDQKQHIEYARDIALKFNNVFGETFKLPAEIIRKEVAIVPGIDGQKMSKSYGNTIPLFGTKDEIAKAVMSIVTDSGLDDENKVLSTAAIDEMLLTGKNMVSSTYMHPINVYRIHSLFKTHEELVLLYTKNGNNYKAIKEALVEDIEKVVAPMRAKRDAISDEEVKKVLSEGAEKARAIASAKMKVVREKIGVALY